MHVYKYTPLSDPLRDIRLLTLLPGSFADDLRIQIRHVPLEEAEQPDPPERSTAHELQQSLPAGWTLYETRERRFVFVDADFNSYWDHPDKNVDKARYTTTKTFKTAITQYEALSYTWGVEESEDIQEKIQVVAADSSPGQDEGFLRVRSNLASAMRHLRIQDESRVLWTDFLCINQNDVTERSEQVVRMADIFELASQVNVWLGETSARSTLGLKSLKDLGDQLLVTNAFQCLRYPGTTLPDWYDSSIPLAYEYETWASMKEIFARPYFERLWIWQEIILADTRAVVHCGMDQIPWVTLRGAIVRLFHQHSNIPAKIRTRYWHVRSLAISERNDTFLYLMDWSSQQLCLDPRDKVYSVLGLLHDSIRLKIQPDYTLSVADVYKNAFQVTLEVSKHLLLLAHCDLQTKLPDGPSWVPNWRVQKSGAVLSAGLYNASGPFDSDAQYFPSDDPNALVVSGVHITTVESVSSHAIDTECSTQALRNLRESLPEELDAKYITGETILEAYAASLVAGSIHDIFQWAPWTELAESCKSLEEHVTKADLNIEDDIHAMNDLYIKTIFEHCHGHVLFRSHDGYIGIAPSSAQPGDIISIVLGCSVPVLLRKQENSNHHILVGPIYVHGLMYSEGLLGQLPLPWKPRFWLDVAHSIGAVSFYNTETGVTTFEDPRLPPLSPEWRISQEIDDNNGARQFENTQTSETTTEDPRMKLEVLKERGLKVHTLTLV